MRRVLASVAILALLAAQATAGCGGGVALDAGGPGDGSADVTRVDGPDAPFDAVSDAGVDAVIDAGSDVSVATPADASPDACRAPADGAADDGTAPPAACRDGSCGAGERCNPWTGRCQPASPSFPPPNGDNGAACTSDSDCRSNGGLGAGRLGVGVCDSPGAGGWPGGYCRSYCNLCPGATGVGDGSELGRGNCPAGSVCLPVFYAIGAGYGACLRECQSDSDCRSSEGYYCRRTIGGRTYANGYCAPGHCRSRGCPASYECFC